MELVFLVLPSVLIMFTILAAKAAKRSSIRAKRNYDLFGEARSRRKAHHRPVSPAKSSVSESLEGEHFFETRDK